MSKAQLFVALSKLLGLDADTTRRICVTVAMAQYGEPSTVVIEQEGTPARMPIIASGLGYGWESAARVVLVGTKKLGPTELKRKICELIDQYVKNW